MGFENPCPPVHNDIVSPLHLLSMGRDRHARSKQPKLVIQGLHMVSDTRCPAGSDSVMKWSESRAAAPKGRCPVEHRGEFPDVLGGGQISGLR